MFSHGLAAVKRLGSTAISILPVRYVFLFCMTKQENLARSRKLNQRGSNTFFAKTEAAGVYRTKAHVRRTASDVPLEQPRDRGPAGDAGTVGGTVLRVCSVRAAFHGCCGGDPKAAESAVTDLASRDDGTIT